MKIKKIINEDAPLELLLLADPSEEAIKKHLKKGSCFVAFEKDEIAGVYVIIEKLGGWEIMNIAVVEKMQNKGLGKLLVADAKKRAKKAGVKKLTVGTGNSSISQLAFYQKCGFRIAGVRKDHFVKNYKKPIFENGIQCRDMVVLELYL